MKSYTGNDQSVLEIRRALSEIIESAINQTIHDTVSKDEIPGVYQWKNSGIGWPKDIRDNYYEFRKELSGGLSEMAKAFLSSRETKTNK